MDTRSPCTSSPRASLPTKSRLAHTFISGSKAVVDDAAEDSCVRMVDADQFTPEIAQFVEIDRLPEFAALAGSLPLILDSLIEEIDSESPPAEVVSDRQFIRLSKHAKSIAGNLRAMDLVLAHWTTLQLPPETRSEIERMQEIARVSRVRLSVIQETVKAAAAHRSTRSN